MTAQMLPGAKLLLGLPQPFGRVERPAKAAFDVGAVFLGALAQGDVGQPLSAWMPPPEASTEPECSTVTRSVFIIWVGMVRVMRDASRPSRWRCSPAF